jgi:hypothetical protein
MRARHIAVPSPRAVDVPRARAARPPYGERDRVRGRAEPPPPRTWHNSTRTILAVTDTLTTRARELRARSTDAERAL